MEEKILLKKYEPTCIFTGNADDLIYFKGKMISKSVIPELIELYNSMTKSSQ